MADEPEMPGPHWENLTARAAEAADQVDVQIKTLQEASPVLATDTPATRAAREVTKEAAILAALVARQTTADSHIPVRALLDRLEDLEQHLDQAAGRLAGSIDRFTTATDASTKKLATWTMVMAIATAALVLTGVAQIVLALLHKT